MARIFPSTHYSSRKVEFTVDLGRLLLLVLQTAVVGGIAIFIGLAVAHAILGAPQPEPVYAPYN